MDRGTWGCGMEGWLCALAPCKHPEMSFRSKTQPQTIPTPAPRIGEPPPGMGSPYLTSPPTTLAFWGEQRGAEEMLGVHPPPSRGAGAGAASIAPSAAVRVLAMPACLCLGAGRIVVVPPPQLLIITRQICSGFNKGAEIRSLLAGRAAPRCRWMRMGAGNMVRGGTGRGGGDSAHRSVSQPLTPGCPAPSQTLQSWGGAFSAPCSLREWEDAGGRSPCGCRGCGCCHQSLVPPPELCLGTTGTSSGQPGGVLARLKHPPLWAHSLAKKPGMAPRCALA